VVALDGVHTYNDFDVFVADDVPVTLVEAPDEIVLDQPLVVGQQ
jgi:hypothetical protein